jgi:hypothetical protein
MAQPRPVYISCYRAFIPALLPPNLPVQVEEELQVLLSEGDPALGRLDGSIQTHPHPDMFSFQTQYQE